MKRVTATLWGGIFAATTLASAMVLADPPNEDRPERPRGEQVDGERGERGPGRGPSDRGPGDRGPGSRGPSGPRDGEGRPPFGPPPIIRALDADGDGKLSAEEIENASAALKTLDKDGDGVLSLQELVPGRPPGDRFGGRDFRPGDRPQRPDGDRPQRPEMERPQRPEGDRPRPEGREEAREDGPRFGERGPRDGFTQSREGDRRPGGPGGPGRGGDRPGFGDFFSQMDKDGDGKLSKEEMPERMQQGMERLDTNKDGFVDKAEIEQMMERFREGRPGGPGARGEGRPGSPEGRRPGGPGGMPSFDDMFNRLDANGDGKITKDEARERMKEQFDKVDANSDGGIDKDEMRKAAEQMRGGRPGGPEGRPGPGGPEGRRGPGGPGGEGQRGPGGLMRLDTDGDGKISKEEAPERMRENFERFDANGDGFIDQSDMEKMMERFREGGRRPQGEEKQPGKDA